MAFFSTNSFEAAIHENLKFRPTKYKRYTEVVNKVNSQKSCSGQQREEPKMSCNCKAVTSIGCG